LERSEKIIRFGAPLKIGSEKDIAWFEVPESQEKRISLSSEPYLRALLPLASVEGYRLVFEQPLDPYSVYSCQRWLSMLQSWLPSSYRTVEIEADLQEVADPEEGETLFTYSGGVDSLYTVYRHHVCSAWSPYELSTAMLVHGLDIPLEEGGHFDVVLHQAKKVLEPLDLEVINLKTNIKSFNRIYLYEHPATIAACFMAVGSGGRTGIIASTGSPGKEALRPGSTPFTDPQLGYSGFKIENGDWEVSRMEKIRGIGNWEAGKNHLRVCYVNKEYSKNCGKCTKCINTMLGFKITTGEVPEAFHTELTPEIVGSMKLRTLDMVKRAMQIYALAESEGLASDPLFRALRRAIRKWYLVQVVKSSSLGQRAKAILRKSA
jgi:hypothetical protein